VVVPWHTLAWLRAWKWESLQRAEPIGSLISAPAAASSTSTAPARAATKAFIILTFLTRYVPLNFFLSSFLSYVSSRTRENGSISSSLVGLATHLRLIRVAQSRVRRVSAAVRRVIVDSERWALGRRASPPPPPSLNCATIRHEQSGG